MTQVKNRHAVRPCGMLGVSLADHSHHDKSCLPSLSLLVPVHMKQDTLFGQLGRREGGKPL